MERIDAMSFQDASGSAWYVHPFVQRAAGGTAAAALRFVSPEGRILVSPPIALAEKHEELANWESALAPALIARAFAGARFEGAFSRAAR